MGGSGPTAPRPGGSRAEPQSPRAPTAPLAMEEPKSESPRSNQAPPKAIAGTGAVAGTTPVGEQAPEDQRMNEWANFTRWRRTLTASPPGITESECFQCAAYPRHPGSKIYSRETLLNIRVKHAARIVALGCDLDVLYQHRILSVSTLAATRKRRKRKRCERKQRRGKRAGIHARIKANPSRPAAPSLLLSDVRSLDNKLDELCLLRDTHSDWRDCCVLALTETWLHDNIPDAAIQLEGMSSFRADRVAASSGKSRGGGLCIYINKDWCVNATVAAKHCSQLAEFLIVKCRPFYLPREFSNVIVAVVYIAPSTSAKANANEALGELHDAISELVSEHPDSFVVVA